MDNTINISIPYGATKGRYFVVFHRQKHLFHFLMVRLTGTRLYPSLQLKRRFQFLMVRLKVSRELCVSEQCIEISIPYGAIKGVYLLK